MTYNLLLSKLKKDIKDLNLQRHKLNEHQKSMLDFIEGRKSSSQYILDGQVVQLTRGNKDFGFEHILINHYQEESNGKLTPREILSLWSTFEKGNPTTDFEQEQRDSNAYRLIKEIKPQIKKEIKKEIKEKFELKKRENNSINVDIEVKKEINDLIKYETVSIRLLLVYFKDSKVYRILTYYSDREIDEEIGDLS